MSCEHIEHGETYYYSTEEGHPDNTATMCDFLDNELSEDFTLEEWDGTYVEVRDKNTGQLFACHAGGNGDSFNHKIEFEELTE